MITWSIDQAHSSIGFKIKHLVVSTVKGNFSTYSAHIAMDGGFETAKINFSADASSISTNNTMRDDHLKSADFFDVASFPLISFVSKQIIKNSDTEFTVLGDLTMHGVVQEISLDTVYNGTVLDMQGAQVMSFDITGSFSRSSFGLTWNAALETGGFAVSDIVTLEMIAEFKQEEVV